jgi:hypothetical protein
MTARLHTCIKQDSTSNNAAKLRLFFEMAKKMGVKIGHIYSFWRDLAKFEVLKIGQISVF